VNPVIERVMSDSIEVTDSIVIAGATPLTIMGANTVAWYRCDQGVTLVGNDVSQWNDLSPNGFNLTQAGAANRPLFVVGGGPNGGCSILFDGTDDSLRNATIDRPAPGTTPTVIWMVFRQVTWTDTRTLFGFGANQNHMCGRQTTASPELTQFNAGAGNANANTALAVNTYGRGEFGFAVADYVKLIATTVSGGDPGNTNPGASFRLGGSSTDTLRTNIEVCELAIFDAVPSAGQSAALDAYVTSLYGPGLV
jgi:hypothetical protein